MCSCIAVPQEHWHGVPIFERFELVELECIVICCESDCNGLIILVSLVERTIEVTVWIFSFH